MKLRWWKVERRSLPSLQRAGGKNQCGDGERDQAEEQEPFDAPGTLQALLALGAHPEASHLLERFLANLIGTSAGGQIERQLEEHLASAPGDELRPLLGGRGRSELNERRRRPGQPHPFDQLEQLEQSPSVALVGDRQRQRAL